MDNVEWMEQYNGSEIAIIGMSGRFPGAHNLDAFWHNLREGKETISFLTDAELETSNIDPAIREHPNYVKAASLLEDTALFDASFFGYAPKEAEIMDPQQRLFLECAWEALENAGYNPDTYKGAIGVYAGARTNTYLFNLFSNPQAVDGFTPFEIGLGNDLAFLSSRVAYKFNLRGPACSVHTACSTGLVAVHLACQSLLVGECQMALAGSVAIHVPQKTGYLYQEGGIVSPDGHCRTFDKKSNGTLFGSGIGIVVLKRLHDALRDGDYIYALIKGTAINNDGSAKANYTAPSVEGQAEVILEALAVSEVPPETITYIESHGTGTHLGDPIEIRALTKAFRTETSKKRFCAIGSVKTNFGHLDAAAGMAGLIKTVLALKQEALPPTLHYEQPNPNIDFENSPFYVNTTFSEWKRNGVPRRAGVSAFGIGGTNAHLILEEAPPETASEHSRTWHLLPLSAKTESALETATTNLAAHLKQHPDLKLADVAYTLQTGRKVFNHSRIALCRSPQEAAEILETRDPRRVLTAAQAIRERPVIFMFPGGDAQYVNMGRDLYREEPLFRHWVDHCTELLVPYLGFDLRHILYPDEEKVEEATARLNQISLMKPALFVIEYALAQLWMSWGVHPQAMIGHSFGEYVAACLAGVFSLQDALMLIAVRGQLMQELPAGKMLAVSLPENEVLSLLNEPLSLATVNGVDLCVVSGPIDAIDALAERLEQAEVSHRQLRIARAAHSRMMDPIVDRFVARVKQVELSPPQIAYVSCLSGTWITAEQATDPYYWGQHLCQTVRFADGLQELLQTQHAILLDVGPGRVLSRLARQHPALSASQYVLASMRHPRDRQSDVAFLLHTLGKLWLAGTNVNWTGLYAHQRHRLPLPTYPFERQRFWIESQVLADGSHRRLQPNKKLGMDDWFYIPIWKQSAAPLSPAPDDTSTASKWWLVFANDNDSHAEIVNRLKQENEHVITILPGEHFHQQHQDTYTINPHTRTDYETLISTLHQQDQRPSKVIHLWSTRAHAAQAGIERFDQIQKFGFYSLLFLVQALGEQNVTDPLQLIVVSTNLHEVTGNEALDPAKSTILGPCKVIPLEYPHITCRNIDVGLSKARRARSRVADQLAAEIHSAATDEVVAYRGRYRWVQTFDSVQLPPAAENPPILRQNGTYLITGGLGGTGLVIARYLARTVQPNLILTGRTGLPNRADWSQWLDEHEAQDRISQRIRKVQALETLGAKTLVLKADVADRTQMETAVAQAESQLGQIHGVIHTAGVIGGGVMQLKTAETITSVLHPKAKGMLVLDALFGHKKCDFLLAFSSISAILGEFGQSDYCAANIFLDTFARQKTAANGPFTVSVNWDTWKEVGMTVDTVKMATMPPEITEKLKQELAAGITSEEGANVFARILSQQTLPQVIVSTKDLHRQIQDVKKFTLSHILKVLDEEGATRPAHPRPNLQNDYVAPNGDIEEKIASVWQHVLGVEKVGTQDDFFDLGGHSLLATRIVSRLSDTFGLKLSLEQFFEATCIAELAVKVAELQTVQENQDKLEVLEMLAELSDEEAETALRESSPDSSN